MTEVHCDKPFFDSQISFDSSEVKMLPMTSEGSTMNRIEGVELLEAHGHLLTCPDEKLLPESIDCFGTNEAAAMPVRQDGSCACAPGSARSLLWASPSELSGGGGCSRCNRP